MIHFPIEKVFLKTFWVYGPLLVLFVKITKCLEFSKKRTVKTIVFSNSVTTANVGGNRPLDESHNNLYSIGQKRLKRVTSDIYHRNIIMEKLELAAIFSFVVVETVQANSNGIIHTLFCWTSLALFFVCLIGYS